VRRQSLLRSDHGSYFFEAADRYPDADFLPGTEVLAIDPELRAVVHDDDNPCLPLYERK
jgi:hypothetical protein